MIQYVVGSTTQAGTYPLVDQSRCVRCICFTSLYHQSGATFAAVVDSGEASPRQRDSTASGVTRGGYASTTRAHSNRDRSFWVGFRNFISFPPVIGRPTAFCLPKELVCVFLFGVYATRIEPAFMPLCFVSYLMLILAHPEPSAPVSLKLCATTSWCRSACTIHFLCCNTYSKRSTNPQRPVISQGDSRRLI